MFRVHVGGLKEVDAALAKFGPALGAGVLAKALEVAAQPTVERAKALAPFDPTRTRKKHLRDSIVATTKLKRGQRRYVTTPGVAHVFIGATVPHGSLIEFGHALVKGKSKKGTVISHTVVREETGRGRGRFLAHRVIRANDAKSGRVIGHVPAKPFLRPAWDATRNEVLARFTRAIAELIAATARAARTGAAAGTIDARALESLRQGVDS